MLHSLGLDSLWEQRDSIPFIIINHSFYCLKIITGKGKRGETTICLEFKDLWLSKLMSFCPLKGRLVLWEMTWKSCSGFLLHICLELLRGAYKTTMKASTFWRVAALQADWGHPHFLSSFSEQKVAHRALCNTRWQWQSKKSQRLPQ